MRKRNRKLKRENWNGEKTEGTTHATSDLGIGLDGEMVLYLGILANPKNNANLVPNRL